jgi:SpoVK/Ycf46/Vps4 family AAA+-type ATPase
MFQVDKIRKVSLNSQAFHSLALPPDKKNLISSLVSFQGALSEYESLISGKGKGLILLHGPPGVGKTFTAGKVQLLRKDMRLTDMCTESIADHTERPLYRLDSGQLSGFNAPFMEANLIRALSLAQKWGAVVLLDEADVFMQQRGLQDLKRNSVVSCKLYFLSPSST